jgi:cyclophilin family peptidyl-prolyl cis-trans isomerase
VRRLLLAPLLLLLLLAGCGGDSGSGSKPKAAAKKAPKVEGCEQISELERSPAEKQPKPTRTLDPSKTYVATVQTNCGTFTIKLDAKDSPKTTASFVSLAKHGFYDGLAIFRVSPGYVFQGGDPNNEGSGGPGYTVVEPPKPSLHYTRGTVAMAKSQSEPAGASGSQFFVTLAEDATVSDGLTPDYALLGKVASGSDVVERIGAVPSDPSTERPNIPIVIDRITIATS